MNAKTETRAGHVFDVQVYYEDTDFSGVVYHANYLRYFERAREHALGSDELVRLWRDDKLGFVVYKAALTFKDGAVFGDLVEIRSWARLESEVRVVFTQQAVRKRDGKLLVEGTVEMVCIDENKRVVPLPITPRLRAVLDG
jgi:acyl-CoA thioester hydrolase